MGEAPEPEKDADAQPDDDQGGTINDPLTRDVGAPRAKFEGRKPE